MASVLNIPIGRNEMIGNARSVLTVRAGRVIFIGWFASMFTPIPVLLEILSRGF